MAGSEFLLTLTFTKQGKVVGSTTRKADGSRPLGGMICHGFDYGVTSPIDPGTGQPVGRRKHNPIVIRREIDSASPKFFHAFCTNEGFSTATLSFDKTGSAGKPSQIRKIELRDGAVVGIRPARSAGGKKCEEVTLTYEEILIEGRLGSAIPRSMLG